MELKPKANDTQTFIKNTKNQVGDQFTTLLKARANSTGLKCDATMRNKQDMEPNLKQCLTCKKCVEEILTHVMLQYRP